jgi:hypothetical protein
MITNGCIGNHGIHVSLHGELQGGPREMFVALASPHCSLGTIDPLKGGFFPRGENTHHRKKTQVVRK